MICARSILVIPVPAACQSLTQKVRVSPWTANVEPSFITETGSAVQPSRNSSSSSATNGLNCSNCTSTSRSLISAAGNSTGPLDSSKSRLSVCSLRFFTTGMVQTLCPVQSLMYKVKIHQKDFGLGHWTTYSVSSINDREAPRS